MDYNKVKYQHIERLGTDATEGIDQGTYYVFAKLDGTNGVLWWEDDRVRCGSRKRELTAEKDNAGFFAKFSDSAPLTDFFTEHPNLVIYGEWLVHHTVNYVEMAYKKFYVFDVFDMDEHRYLPYMEYTDLISKIDPENILVVPPMATVKDSPITSADIQRYFSCTGLLLQDPTALGEGIVIKNYDYKNIYGRVVWAKVVRDEYKQQKYTKIETKGENPVEELYISKFCTNAFIVKEFEKVKELHEGKWETKFIGRLLGHVYHELVVENTWEFIKKYKNPTVNFRVLRKLCDDAVKKALPELF